MTTHADKTQDNRGQSVSNAVSQRRIGEKATSQFMDNRPEAVAQRKLQDSANNSPHAKQAAQFQLKDNKTSGLTNFTNEANPIQMVAIGTINCPNIGDIPSLGNMIHGKLQADYIANGTAHATWLRGAEFPTALGQRPDISLRTPALGIVRSVGEIKPVASAAAGAAQIAVHQGPGNQLNAASPVINDPAWAAAASFPVTDLDAAAVSPSGNVNVTPVAATPGLYTYDG